MKTILILPLALVVLLGACRQAPQSPQTDAPAGEPGEVRVWPLLSEHGAAQPDLAVAPDDRLLLSWISVRPGRDNALQFAAYGNDGRWQSSPRTIAVGEALLSNWADTPHIAATADGALWVHWLQKTSTAAGQYDLVLSRSANRGFNWSAPVTVNSDSGGEHGFASLWPASPSALGVAWLNPVAAADGAHAAHSAGMGLRTASFDASLQRSDDRVLDEMTCECCQTDAALTTRGVVLVYRDRDADQVRDIAALRFDGQDWSTPAKVHADGWKMPACPVNGPAVAAHGDDVVVAWYTAAGDKPAMKLARSRDAGASFAAPVQVDHGTAVLGRVDVAHDADGAWVLWLREEAGAQSLWLARYSTDLAREVFRKQIATLQGRGAAIGFPKLALRADGAYAVWTDVVDGQPKLRGVQVLR
ncbi:hypothetical protein IP90_03207 [Luteimonas cucumeris]|uniref:BNR repeat protein n=1 Tax=Luteimonas cucumeris TaxID=985012 RepID=A0A562KUV2_9GAMM|nr:hypothetical protein [Luteimonas cucumeris]TWH99116.1 hypothetical protein IP90_03207 [Luteimonas cucumeris]